jgi:regulatory protein
MTIISIKTGTGAGLTRIALSDGSLFSFRDSYLAEFPGERPDSGRIDRLVAGEEISAGEEGAFRFAATCLRAERAALRLTARAEQTVMGLSRKLARRGFEAPCIQAVLRHLGALDLVDDRRFAGRWLQSRLARQREPPRRLLAGLRNRGIGREDAEEALKAALNFQAEATLLRGYIEKLRLSPAADGIRSLKYRLRGEGFSAPVIQDYWEEQEW